MSDDLGNPGEPVAEVDPDDLKGFWQETRNLQARHPGQNVGMGLHVMKPPSSRARTYRRSGIARA